MKKLWVAAVAALLATVAPSQSVEAASKLNRSQCQQVLQLHGMLSRAQFECGFSGYSEALIVMANDCPKVLSKSTMTKILSKGMSDFKKAVKEETLPRACMMIEIQFGDWVKP